jgi:hypothetical protein
MKGETYLKFQIKLFGICSNSCVSVSLGLSNRFIVVVMIRLIITTTPMYLQIFPKVIPNRVIIARLILHRLMRSIGFEPGEDMDQCQF